MMGSLECVQKYLEIDAVFNRKPVNLVCVDLVYLVCLDIMNLVYVDLLNLVYLDHFTSLLSPNRPPDIVEVLLLLQTNQV